MGSFKIRQFSFAVALLLWVLSQSGCVVIAKGEPIQGAGKPMGKVYFLGFTPDKIQGKRFDRKTRKYVTMSKKVNLEIDWIDTIVVHITTLGVSNLGFIPVAYGNTPGRHSDFVRYDYRWQISSGAQQHTGTYSAPTPSFSGPSR